MSVHWRLARAEPLRECLERPVTFSAVWECAFDAMLTRLTVITSTSGPFALPFAPPTWCRESQLPSKTDDELGITLPCERARGVVAIARGNGD